MKFVKHARYTLNVFILKDVLIMMAIVALRSVKCEKYKMSVRKYYSRLKI